jgi:hypothetical protein
VALIRERPNLIKKELTLIMEVAPRRVRLSKATPAISRQHLDIAISKYKLAGVAVTNTETAKIVERAEPSADLYLQLRSGVKNGSAIPRQLVSSKTGRRLGARGTS